MARSPRDVARVSIGPEIRRGLADWNGEGETVGGIVVVRSGADTLSEGLEPEVEPGESLQLLPNLRGEGLGLHEAVIQGARRRFRPIDS